MKRTGILLLAGCVLLPAAQPAGTVNAVTGDVIINGQPIHSPGPVAAGAEIRTGLGMAEVLLTPGSFLRLGNRTSVELTSQTTVDVKSGVAILEFLSSTGTVSVGQNGVASIVHGPGLFEFDRSGGTVMAFSGNADLRKGQLRITITGGFQAATRNLRTRPIKPRADDALYAWASYRSEQLSSESAAVQPSDVPRDQAGRPAWVKLAWSDAYTFISPSGSVQSPFGWPFYAPGDSHNYLPLPGSGDSYLYGHPALPFPAPVTPMSEPRATPHPPIPLTAPGVPTFPKPR